MSFQVSLHATKLVSSVEGGLILYEDSEAIERMIAWSNFGIFYDKPITTIGTNAKLSEIHAAYGIKSLQNWPQLKNDMMQISKKYTSLLRDHLPELKLAPNIERGLTSSTFNVYAENVDGALDANMYDLGVETRRWWRKGVHKLPAFQKFSRSKLAVTERLASQVIGLPYYLDLEKSTQNQIVKKLSRCLSRPK